MHKYFSANFRIIQVLGSSSVLAFTDNIFLALLPIFSFDALKSEFLVGIFIFTMTIFQALFLDTFGGNLGDKKGGLWMRKLGVWILLIGSISWALFGFSIWTLSLYFFCYLAQCSLSGVYIFILEESKREEGGAIFGIEKFMTSITAFLGMLFFPFLAISSNWHLLPLFSITVCCISLFILYSIRDKFKMNKSIHAKDIFNPFCTIRGGIHFIRVSNYVPKVFLLFQIMKSALTSSLWFLIPLSLIQTKSFSGFELSIYDLTTILFSLIIGAAATKEKLIKNQYIIWLIFLACAWGVFLDSSSFSLIIIGFIIALSSLALQVINYHLLIKYNIDHEEEARFLGFQRACSNITYALMPLICGYITEFYSLKAAYLFLAIIVTLLVGIYLTTINRMQV